MIEYRASNTKISDIIQYFIEKSFKMIDDPAIYTSGLLSNLSEYLEENECIALSKTGDIIKLYVSKHMDLVIPEDFANASETVHTDYEDEISRRVLETMVRANINNDSLLKSLAQQTDNIFDDSMPENIILMEKQNDEMA
jgi:hypothetical protein